MSHAPLLAAAGLDPAACSIHLVSRGWLCETWDVRAPAGRYVLEVCDTGLGERLAADPDPRICTLARLFPVAPLFRSFESVIAPIRARLGELVPRVVAESRVPSGRHRALLTWMFGSPLTGECEGSATGLAQSEQIGVLARRLHRAASDRDRDLATWCADLAVALHGLVDRIDAGADFALHRRLLPLLQRFERVAPRRFAHIHGDLHPSDLLVDGDGQVVGLIDFELSGVAPTALDFRWLALLDERRFAKGYGLEAGALDDACRLGHFASLLWQVMRVGVGWRDTTEPPTVRGLTEDRDEIEYQLWICEDDALRIGPVEARQRVRDELSATAREGRTATGTATRSPRVRLGIVVAAWNHWRTTTSPCLDALRRFTDVPYEIVVVDNGSSDETAVELVRLAARDPRVRVVTKDRNLGWARGSQVGLAALAGDASHLVLLNSDTCVTPRWVHGPVGAARDCRGFAVADERAEIGIASPLAEPGSGQAAPGIPLAEVLERAAARAIDQDAPRHEDAPPSGFCLPFGAELCRVVDEYLDRFEDFHSGRASWHAWWTGKGLRCRVARDSYVFHARGGSGGYFDYESASRGGQPRRGRSTGAERDPLCDVGVARPSQRPIATSPTSGAT